MTRGKIKRRFRVGPETYVFASLVAVSFFLLLFSTKSLVHIRDAGLSVFTGARNGIHAASSFAARTLLSINELAALRREYGELLERSARYERLERDSAEIRAENRRLREQLDFSETLSYRHIPAEISGKDPDNVFSALVINKGRRHGMREGMPVIAYQNGMQALAGKIVQAGEAESLVMPLYDRKCFVSARLANARYEGIVEGQGHPGQPLLVRSITRRALDDVKTGDIIVTSGLGGVYPANVIIGRVSKLSSDEYETVIELESAIDFTRLEYVFGIAPAAGESATDGGTDG